MNAHSIGNPQVLRDFRKAGSKLAGARVYLVPFSENHLTAEYISWFNDPEATRCTRHGVDLYTPEKARDFFNSIKDSQNTIVFAIHETATGRHVGNISLCDISWNNHSGEIAIMVGNGSARGKGLGEESVRLVLDFAFLQVRLHRVKMGMMLMNTAMNRIAEKLGFTKEGVLKDAQFKNGVYYDLVQWGKISC